ncbi:protocatechuate 3,4-dioxygenase subunit alpha [Kribbella koreensis]|uniref:Protocatechuate 3,4-dioxygenase subunit alpha n=1 Tax=Kribbella koreensis TaxID=57909 RepID=A0ABN1RD89_9ACTN
MSYVYPVTDVPASPGPTPWQTVGPFFHDALAYAAGPQVAGPSVPGRIRLAGTVFDGGGEPILDALVELWQADQDGRFVSSPGIYEALEGFRGFGRSMTDSGEYEFVTVKPGAVPTIDGRAQAPYIALSIFARGMLRRAVTRVYFPGDDLDGDPLLASLPESRRASLVATPAADGYRFDIHLQGEQETVFLDVGDR